MRSCTGWPSGIWIDEPRRTAPDGSNFQLQHWTHDFDYALVCGDGDWRQRRDPGPQRAVLPPAARRRARDERGAAAAAGRVAAARRTRRLGARSARSRRPATRWRAAAPSRSTRARWRCGWWRRPGTGTRVVDRLRAGQGARAPARRPAGKAAVAGAQTIGRPARLSGGHRAGPARHAQGCVDRRRRRSGPGSRGRPAAVRALLAAQPRARAAGRAAGRRPPAPASA